MICRTPINLIIITFLVIATFLFIANGAHTQPFDDFQYTYIQKGTIGDGESKKGEHRIK